MLEVKNLSFKEILKEISFKAEAGSVTGVIGKNGSGKTTLLKSLSGFLKYSGKVCINSKNIKILPIKERTSVINYLPQEFPHTELTPVDILDIEAQIRNISKEKIASIIKKYSLQNLANQPFYTLSGGEKVRVFLARIELINPEVLLLDEPSAFLDIQITHLLREFIKNMKQKKKTVLIVSNDLNFILNISDNLIGLKNGKGYPLQNQEVEKFIQFIYNTPVKIEKVNGKFTVL